MQASGFKFAPGRPKRSDRPQLRRAGADGVSTKFLAVRQFITTARQWVVMLSSIAPSGKFVKSFLQF